MTLLDPLRERLNFLLDMVALEAEPLQATDRRLFAQPFTALRAATPRDDGALSEQLDALLHALRGCKTPLPTSCCRPEPCATAWAMSTSAIPSC